MKKNLADLIEHAAAVSPNALFGTVEEPSTLQASVLNARQLAQQLAASGLGRGRRVAYIGHTRASYLAIWMGGQLAGVQTAMINPTYPNELLREMLDDLMPDALVWVAREPGDLIDYPVAQFDASAAVKGVLKQLKTGSATLPAIEVGGMQCELSDIAGFMHTSGTSGRPKHCALSHEYFLRLGRFIADTLCLSSLDTVFAPLPMFHINPLGYGIIGSLTACAGVLGAERFSASQFWPTVKRHEVSAMILHLPPASILKASTTPEDAKGHKIRIGFGCDPEFLEIFGVGIGVGGFGSTEAGGQCHTWHYRAGDPPMAVEGPLRYGGRMRYDMEWRLDGNDEILVRGRKPNVTLTGYLRNGQIASAFDAEGWFHTGDRGRTDEWGNLVFIERFSESIRVKGEYVPVDFVEERLRKIAGLEDFALWGKASEISGQEAVIYSTTTSVPVHEIKDAVKDLPAFMHPREVICVEALPRDTGVGKIQRRRLPDMVVREVVQL